MSGGKWFVGSLRQTFPPIVPRLRTCTSAIVRATSARIGRASCHVRRELEVGEARHRADHETAVPSTPDASQLRDRPEVDQDVRGRRARLHDVQERLAAGQWTGVRVLGEEQHRFVHR